MINFFYGLNPCVQSLIASLLTFTMTTIGAAFVFFFKNVNKFIMNVMLALSAGIMLSAGIFSLLLPAISESISLGMNYKLIISLSILIATLFLIIGEVLIDRKIKNDSNTNLFMLIVSILLHNIPEGMSIGVAFASVIYGIDNVTIYSAISLAIGIGIQNLPEGAAISIPLRRSGYSRKKSFLIGSLTGSIEILAAFLGAILVLKIKVILPFLLAIAAGAMIFVVVLELIPEALNDKRKRLLAFLVLVGFTLMMLLEI